jgi:hypothetical protein
MLPSHLLLCTFVATSSLVGRNVISYNIASGHVDSFVSRGIIAAVWRRQGWLSRQLAVPRPSSLVIALGLFKRRSCGEEFLRL